MTDSAGALVATTSRGRLRGAREHDVVAFRNVPYGTAPTGPRRWRPADPAPSWTGVRDATVDGPVCPQPCSGPVVTLVGDPVGDVPPSEDCLTLTVWTPQVDDRRRPVLLWIHGGGFIRGAGSWDVYSGANLARHGDIVVVSINYRLGPFGYLRVDEDDPTGGNLWLSDQRLALEWTIENIAAFGGDPQQITVGGQSGGAWSTMALLGLPDPPPVTRAVLLSAPLMVRSRTPQQSRAVTERYMQALGASTVDDMRKLPASTLVDAVPQLLPGMQEFATVVPPFMPTLHEPLVPADVVPRFVERATDIEVLVGWTSEEMGFFLPADPTMWELDRQRVVERMRPTFGSHAEAAYDVYAREGASPYEVLLQYTSDEGFRMPALDMARQLGIRGGRSWTYEFDVPSPAYDGLAGAAHCVDIPFFLDLLDVWQNGGTLLAGMNTDANQALADRMHASLIAFVRNGDPSTPDLPWTPATDAAVPTMRFAATCEETRVAEPLVDLWRSTSFADDAT